MVGSHVLFPEEHESEISFLKKITHLIVINNFYKQISENLGKFQTNLRFSCTFIIIPKFYGRISRNFS